MRETLHIRDDRSLARLVERLADASELALDTEFLRERTYYPKLCLLQLATSDLLALVDPFAVRDLDPLWETLTSDVEVVLHAAGQDLEIVQRLAGTMPSRWFDTQVGAAFLGYGDAIGYSRLVERVIGKAPQHGEAYTDWSRRPLTPEQSRYALDDVRYLLECADHVRGELRSRGRLGWVYEELEEHSKRLRCPLEPEAQWTKVSGGRRLRGLRLAILREVAAWRERAAQERDLPRQRVVPDRVLVEIARRAPKSEAQVERLRGLHPREVGRSAAAIVQTVRRAEALSEERWPRWPTLPANADDPNVDALASFLDAYLRSRARELELSPRLLGARQELVLMAQLAASGELAARGPERLRLLRGWRRQTAGAELVELLEGKAALRVVDGARLVREP